MERGESSCYILSAPLYRCSNILETIKNRIDSVAVRADNRRDNYRELVSKVGRRESEQGSEKRGHREVSKIGRQEKRDRDSKVGERRQRGTV